MSDIESITLADAAALEPEGDGRYRVELQRQFTVFEYPNGGYLQCVMANAAVAAASEAGASHLHATAVSTNFVVAPSVGPAQVKTEVRRVGRGASFVHVTLSQDGHVATESIVSVGTLKGNSAVRYQSSRPPVLAAREECVDLPIHEVMSIHQAVQWRYDPGSFAWWSRESGPGEIAVWIRLRDTAAPWNAWSVLFAADALPPATLSMGSTGWVPTLQLTSYVRRIPTSEWLRARQWCVVVGDGLVDERCELFDDTDELVASSSQLAMVRFGQG